MEGSNGDWRQHQERAEGSLSKRRGFLKKIALMVTSWRVKSVATIVGGVVVTGTTSPVSATSYLNPAYIPPGFRFVQRYVARDDGFGGGQSEIAPWYVNTTSAMGGNRPLVLFQTPSPRHVFFATSGQPGQAVTLKRSTGEVVRATYHDGFWTVDNGRRRWASGDVHSLTFTVGGLTVAVRGSRLVGITGEELVKVAAGLS